MSSTFSRAMLALAFVAAVLAVPSRHARAQATDSTKAKVDSSKSKVDSAKTAAPSAAADTNPVRTFGGFVDTYYAWDANQPHNFDRANYAGEPKLGVVSGPNVSQFIQEATVADFSPYYEAGVKLTWAASPKLTAGRNNVFFVTSLAPTF